MNLQFSGSNLLTAFFVLLAAASAARVLWSRWPATLGESGAALGSALLAILWFGGLALGQASGALWGMAAVGALPLLALAWPRRKEPWKRAAGARWSRIDLAVFAFLAALVLVYVGHDITCHFYVIGQYLRGAVPPTAPNDPMRPLPYHPGFDAVAAVLARAFSLRVQTAIGLASILCLAATISALVAVSRALMPTPAKQQAARLFFLLGMGPVYLRLLGGGDAWRWRNIFHGRAVQSYAEALLRRPMGLSFLTFAAVLAVVLPRVRTRLAPGAGAKQAPHLAWLVPLGFVAMLTGEELAVVATAALIVAAAQRALPWRWIGAWIAALGAGALVSSLGRGFADPAAGQLVPGLAVAWSPPTLGTWLFELGPLSLIALALSLKDPRGRVAAAPLVAGLVVVSFISVGPWPDLDLYRFLFSGAAIAAMLCARWTEDVRSVRTWIVGALLLLGPVGYVSFQLFLAARGSPLEGLSPDPIASELRASLAAVGPREAVLAAQTRAQWLSLAGFSTIAPMTGPLLGAVTPLNAHPYAEDPRRAAPAWLLTGPGDPLAAGREIAGRFGGCILVRAPASLSSAQVEAILESDGESLNRRAWPECGESR